MSPRTAASLALVLLLPIVAAAQGTPAGTHLRLRPRSRPSPAARRARRRRESNTGATRDVVSNQQGFYSVPALQPGPYNITVEANGFKTVHQTGIVLEADQQARIDFALTIGSTTETITVEGERAAAQHLRRDREHADRQSVRGQHAVERAQLQHADQSRRREWCCRRPILRAGPIQREWPAPGRELLHRRWRERQPRN